MRRSERPLDPDTDNRARPTYWCPRPVDILMLETLCKYHGIWSHSEMIRKLVHDEMARCFPQARPIGGPDRD